MLEPNSLAEPVERFLALIRAQTLNTGTALQAGRDLVAASRGANAEQLNDAVSRLAPLIPDIEIVRASLLAIACGALAEAGASIAPFAQPTLARFAEALQDAIPCIEACDAEVAASASQSDGGVSPSGREEALTRMASRVGQHMPRNARAFISLKWFNTAAVAVLSRSKALRRQTRADTTFAQASARLAELAYELSCFDELLTILDDEQLVALHPGLGRGYVIRIAGIRNNYQLHTLLADALIGDVNRGWLPGERPSPEVVALAKDAPITDPDNHPSTIGSFNLWNWTGLRADGALPGGLEGSEHWIWNEGIPADVVPFQGSRVILIGPAPYARSWTSGRFFPGMAGELDVLRQMPAEEARNWLDRIARAPKPTPAGRNITASDVADIEG